MAQLVSPGVSVTIVDESFYSAAGPGTVPFILIVTEQDRLDSSGSDIAVGTTAANANKLYLVTSQRDLLQTFGNPKFYTSGGTPMQGYELNEYGLFAAYSYLEVADRAYVMRADVDTAQLVPSSTAPTAAPADGTYWLDLNETKFGLFNWNAADTTWEEQDLYVLGSTDVDGTGVPLTSYAAPVGSFAVVPGLYSAGENRMYYREVAGWTFLDNTNLTADGNDFQFASHINYPTTQSDATALVDEDKWVKTTSPNNGASFVVKVYDASTEAWSELDAPLYATRNAAVAGISSLTSSTLFVRYNPSGDNAAGADAEFYIYIHNGATSSTATGTAANPTVTSGNTFNINGNLVTISGTTVAAVAASINSANITGITASVNALGQIVVANSAGTDITFTAGTGTPLTTLGLTVGSAYSNWTRLTYEASFTEPSTDPAEDTLWYSTSLQVDILENDGLGAWNDFANDIYLQSAEPTAPVAGDLWIDTTDLENYPKIYRRATSSWVLIDNTDQTTPSGILFKDARPLNSGALDADAPDPLLYPSGMLLFNTRYSTYNVKQFKPDYEFDNTVIGDRWVTLSGNKEDGSPYMGRHAVKKVIVDKMEAALNASTELRSEAIYFNLIAAPGFIEVADELINLNVSRKETAFIIGDTPFRLEPTGTAIQAWATNSNAAAENGEDGLLASSAYMAVYYPSGYTSDLEGNNVCVPASHIALRTFAYNDNVAYQWFAPAGYTRGLVSNASSVGYITDEDEFEVVQLDSGLRDTLYSNKINPIMNEPGVGLVVFGQKTLNPVSSALDRVNVARLVNYIRYQAEILGKPFLFEQNDKITRTGVKNAYDRFLGELVTLRGLYDYVVVCDESNNTSARIDRNELWVDIAIQPTKTAEFIYIPIRLKNTGEDLTS